MWCQVRIISGLLLFGSMLQLTPAQAAESLPIVDGKAVLTISGEGYRYRQIYESGEQPALSAFNSSGDVLPDGEYRYQLRSIPMNSVVTNTQQDLLRGKSTRHATGKTSSASVKSGNFEIENGLIIHQ